MRDDVASSVGHVWTFTGKKCRYYTPDPATRSCLPTGLAISRKHAERCTPERSRSQRCKVSQAREFGNSYPSYPFSSSFAMPLCRHCAARGSFIAWRAIAQRKETKTRSNFPFTRSAGMFPGERDHYAFVRSVLVNLIYFLREKKAVEGEGMGERETSKTGPGISEKSASDAAAPIAPNSLIRRRDQVHSEIET